MKHQDKLLTPKEVMELTRLSMDEIIILEKKLPGEYKKFPSPIYQGPKKQFMRWMKHDVKKWMERRLSPYEINDHNMFMTYDEFLLELRNWIKNHENVSKTPS